MISIIIPSRNEKYLGQTVNDLLTKAATDIEIIAVVDGYWPNPPLPNGVKILHRGSALGMRPAINGAIRMARGSYLMKCDAHCMFDESYDAKLLADYHEDNWILTCRRYALNPEKWERDQSNSKYPIDYHYLSTDFHGVEWRARRDSRREILLDDEMSSQGSCWFMSRKHWNWLGEMDTVNYGQFAKEFQEIGLKTWLGGGAVKVTKRTWYAHWHKPTQQGRGYSMGKSVIQQGQNYCVQTWSKHPGLRSFIDRFAPVPTWH